MGVNPNLTSRVADVAFDHGLAGLKFLRVSNTKSKVHGTAAFDIRVNFLLRSLALSPPRQAYIQMSWTKVLKTILIGFIYIEYITQPDSTRFNLSNCTRVLPRAQRISEIFVTYNGSPSLFLLLHPVLEVGLFSELDIPSRRSHGTGLCWAVRDATRCFGLLWRPNK
jgi:hypothetical protein